MDTSNSSVITNDDGSVSLQLDLRVYSLAAIKKAAYKFAADCCARLSKMDEDTLLVTLSFADNTIDSAKQSVAKAFYNEVLDQDLREQIAQETESARNLILAHAFSRISLITEN